MRSVSVLAVVLALSVGCGEVDLGEGRNAGPGGSAGASGTGGTTAGGAGASGTGATTAGGSGGSAGLDAAPPKDASDATVSHEAGWFSCNGTGTACACDGTTHYCYKFSGGASVPPPPDAAVCDPDGGLGCLPLPAGCGPSCDCVMKSVTYPNCKCVESSGNVEVDCTGICASPDTPIDTPSGPRAIAGLRPGDLVYSVDKGRVAAVPIRRVQRVVVHAHSVIHVDLASGSTLEISAPHPTADGRLFGDLAAGDELDGVRILRVERVPYSFEATYDILPDSDTGTYFAGGVLIGTTMAPPATVRQCAAVY